MPGAQSGGEAPGELIDAHDVHTGGEALHHQPNRPGRRIDRGKSAVVLTQDGAPNRVDRTIGFEQADRGVRYETNAVVVRLGDTRETRHVRFSDVATVRRIRTEIEWEALLKKLDERVRALLNEFEVELD